MEVERTTATTRARTPRIVLRVTDAQKFRRDYLGDLADGGVFVKSEKLLPQGAVVDVELHAPGHDEPLPLRGRIDRRVEAGAAGPAGMHVAFEELEEGVARRLVGLVQEFQQPEPAPVPPAFPATTPPPAQAATPTTPGPARAVNPTTPGPAHAATPTTPGPARSVTPTTPGPAHAVTPAAPAAPRAPVATLAAEPWPLPPAPANGAVRAPVRAAADREDGIREVAELRGRLASAEATIRSLQAELAAHEDDEAGTRALAERLALQKNKLERLRKKEAEDAAAAQERLRGELAERTSTVHALETRVAEAVAHAEVEHRARTDAETQGAEWKARADAAAAEHREAVARGEKLAAQLEDTEKLALDAEERAGDLETRLRATEAELGGARAATAEEQRRVEGLVADLAAAAEAHRALEVRVEELEGRLGAEEEAHRAAGARADELARRLDETREAHAVERERLRVELAAAGARADDAGTARDRLDEKLRGAEERLGEALARVADLEGRLASSDDRLERIRAKERDLRRLLAVVSAKAAEDPVDDEAPAAPAVSDGAPADAPEPPAAAASAGSSVEDTLTGRQPSPGDGGVIVAADLLAEAGIDVELPAADTEIPVDMDLEEPPPAPIAFSAFLERLEAGERVRRTEAFRRYKPTEPSEIRLGGWLVQADGLDALRELAGTKLSGERLPRLLFDFYRRGLVDLLPDRK